MLRSYGTLFIITVCLLHMLGAYGIIKTDMNSHLLLKIIFLPIRCIATECV